MITRLHLENFRRHTDTELIFSPTDQLIAIGGANGVGKTTVIEAITVALYGEGRNGRRNLDALVRRGCELEGFTVTLEFSVANTSYRVERRRAERIASAVLYANSAAIVTGPDAVSAEVTKILGMDATGFRLAVLARQKELDGLTSLNKRDRKVMLARLLRIEALSKSVVRAQDRYNQAAAVLRAMGTPPDMEVLHQDHEQLSKDARAASDVHDAARLALVTLDEHLAATHDVDAAYRDATEALARVQGSLSAAFEDRDRLAAECDALAVPAAPAPTRPLSSVSDDLREVSNQIATAQALQTAHDDAEVLRAELAGVEAEFAALGDVNPVALEAEIVTAQADAEALRTRVEETTTERRSLDTRVAILRAQREQIDSDAQRLASLGATCEACGQSVDDAHRTTQHDTLTRRAAQCDGDIEAALTSAQQCQASLAEFQDQHRRATTRIGDLRVSHQQAVSDQARRDELVRRRDTYELRLRRPLPPRPDTDALVRRRDELLLEEAAVRQAERQLADRAQALETQKRLTGELARANERTQARQAELERNMVPHSLAEAYAQRVAALERRKGLADALTEAAAELSTKNALRDAAERRIQDARAFADAHASKARDARIAAHAKALLQDVHDRLSAQLRPSLESAVSDLATRLSEGRFTSVRVSEDYDISVLDDGAYRPLSELSGGEADLVALACRLALASVVAERHGSDAAGLLILDEVFGSQDPARRESILATLRQLRAVYGQIFLISHVGGLEEAADKVIDITASPDRSETEVMIS